MNDCSCGGPLYQATRPCSDPQGTLSATRSHCQRPFSLKGSLHVERVHIPGTAKPFLRRERALLVFTHCPLKEVPAPLALEDRTVVRRDPVEPLQLAEVRRSPGIGTCSKLFRLGERALQGYTPLHPGRSACPSAPGDRASARRDPTEPQQSARGPPPHRSQAATPLISNKKGISIVFSWPMTIS
ncbi:hypothetical protein NDU88_002979 [Pleurodeles waltl]|uniref:Uncharacterized protein n=1 Tax=Pleurodeles waltl TaxID=8319 RepID=A0AAV7TMA6_PLEWA|nr:hypothetical protein NDU88_002979 [Pleurodeles waltl]